MVIEKMAQWHRNVSRCVVDASRTGSFLKASFNIKVCYRKNAMMQFIEKAAFTDFGYKNKEQLLHPKSVKYGRRTPMGIFNVTAYYVIWLGL